MAVLAALEHAPHATVDEIEISARARIGTLSTQAIYDILRAFHGAGLVRRIEPAGSPSRYETRVDDNHHHLVCRDCAAMVDVDCVLGAAPCLDPVDTSGYEIGEAEVIFWGRCPACCEHKGERS